MLMIRVAVRGIIGQPLNLAGLKHGFLFAHQTGNFCLFGIGRLAHIDRNTRANAPAAVITQPPPKPTPTCPYAWQAVRHYSNIPECGYICFAIENNSVTGTGVGET